MSNLQVQAFQYLRPYSRNCEPSSRLQVYHDAQEVICLLEVCMQPGNGRVQWGPRPGHKDICLHDPTTSSDQADCTSTLRY